ncbi:MAG TPA: hypothetical protein VE987_11275 [Polyangiaceae bacterium]|nr:hypothetical protein [Polyangiaceae bacterium]
MSTYTCVYSAIATNVSSATLASALAAVPRDTATEAVLGVTLVSDHTTTSGDGGRIVKRTITYASDASALIPPGAPMASMLQNFYNSTFGRALGTLMTAAPVVVT